MFRIFSFPIPTDEPVSLKEYLLPQEDERLKELFIEREDMRLSDNLPIKGKIGQFGLGRLARVDKAKEFTVHSAMRLLFQHSVEVLEPRLECT